MITMSGLQRALSCDGSLVLPRARNANPWADDGQDQHDDLSDFGNLPPAIAALLPPNARAEVKVAYDVESGRGRIIGEGSGRSYGTLGPFEIAGSIDVLGVDADTVYVVDWKGWQAVAPASRNAQIWGYALAAARALGRDRAVVMIAHVRDMRLLRAPDRHEIEAMDLGEFANGLRTLLVRQAALIKLRKAGEQVTTTEGTWCKHCESKHVCPSKNALLLQVAQRGLMVLGEQTMTMDRAADSIRQLEQLDQLVKDARARATQFVDEHGPIDMGDGSWWGRHREQGNERLDPRTTVRAIADVVGESAKEFASVAVELRVSKAALTRASKEIGAPPKLATAVIKRVRELGGATHDKEKLPVGRFADRTNAAPPPREELSDAEIGAFNLALAEVGG